MDNYFRSICTYHLESSEASYSDDSQADPPYVDDAQYFDIDISSPFSPRESTRAASSSVSDEDTSEDEFDFDFSSSNANPPNPNLCISPAEKLFYQGQLLPLQLIPTPLESDIGIKDTASMQSSSNIPAGVKTQFPKLPKTVTNLKILFLGFGKPAKHGMDLKSSCAENAGTGVGMDSFVPKKNRWFTVKLNVVEVPLVDFRGAKRDGDNGFQKKPEDSDNGEGTTCNSTDRDKKGAKEIVQKYVKKIKPLYVKISQRSNDKIRSGDLEKLGVRNGVKNERCQDSERSGKQISSSYFFGNLKMVYKHLGKGKQSPSDIQQKLPNYYSSESTLMEVQSAIQGAIAHCKQSIN